MLTSDLGLDTSEIHPIDLVEDLAERREWQFDRIADNQITMEVEGAWKTYSITLAWSAYCETLRMICSFEMEPPKETFPQIAALLNLANDHCWSGAFTHCTDQGLMTYRYGLSLIGEATATARQIDHIMSSAVRACDRFYPAFQLVAWAGQPKEDALKIAMDQAYGRA